MEPVIRAKRLTKYYAKTCGVEDLSLEVFPGEIFGFLGPNGAGKTTTIRLFLDLIRPTNGQIELFGKPLGQLPATERRRIGYLPGEFTLVGSMTPLSILRLMGRLSGSIEPKRSDELTERFGLASSLHRPIRHLSEGTKQKLGILLAFIHDPELLILDEPTESLDPLMQQEFFKMLAEAVDRGRSIFLSTHILSEAERVCNRVGIIRNGRLVAVEDVEVLRANTPRLMEIVFRNREDALKFNPENAETLERHDSVVRIRFSGSPIPYIKAAAQWDIEDLKSHPAKLEDVFLHYYGGTDRSDKDMPK